MFGKQLFALKRRKGRVKVAAAQRPLLLVISATKMARSFDDDTEPFNRHYCRNVNVSRHPQLNEHAVQRALTKRLRARRL